VKPSANAPDPPSGLRVSSITSTSLLLEWNPSVPVNLLHTVHYFATAGGVELQKIIDKGNTAKIIITDLEPFTNYTFYVVAYQWGGASQHSQHITAMTTEDLPIAAPSISVAPVSSTSLRLRWGDLPPEQARGVITKYKLFYRIPAVSSAVRVELIDGNLREYILMGLQPTTKYEL
jgi:neogenin